MNIQAGNAPPNEQAEAGHECRSEADADKKRATYFATGGPSLGRKRPRRAYAATLIAAPQQYACALHKKQDKNHYIGGLRRIVADQECETGLNLAAR